MPRTQTTANARAAEYWSQVAPSWLEFEPELETISERPGQLAMNRLDLELGHTVVDLGCGSGLTTVQLAERVGEAGSALGVDLSAELLGQARRHADRHGAGNVEFLAADIQTDHLGAARFDRAYSRFGLMFCADPPRPSPTSGTRCGPAADYRSSASRAWPRTSGCSSPMPPHWR